MTLNFLEQFAVGLVITLLTELETKATNTVEKNAIAASLVFLQTLMSSQTKKLTSQIGIQTEQKTSATQQIHFGKPSWLK